MHEEDIVERLKAAKRKIEKCESDEEFPKGKREEELTLAREILDDIILNWRIVVLEQIKNKLIDGLLGMIKDMIAECNDDLEFEMIADYAKMGIELQKKNLLGEILQTYHELGLPVDRVIVDVVMSITGSAVPNEEARGIPEHFGPDH